MGLVVLFGEKRGHFGEKRDHHSVVQVIQPTVLLSNNKLTTKESTPQRAEDIYLPAFAQ